MVRESFGLSRMDQEERKLPGFRLQQWFFFVVATFYLYFRCEGGGGAQGQARCGQGVKSASCPAFSCSSASSLWRRFTFTFGARGVHRLRGCVGGV